MTTKETTSIHTPEKFHLTDKHIHVLVNISTITKESFVKQCLGISLLKYTFKLYLEFWRTCHFLYE